MTIWHMSIPCWISKATDTHLEYVTVFVFPLQQWLDESASMLRYITWPAGQSAGPYTHTTGSKLRFQTPTKHTTKYL